mmetsp:Transcript_42212/g.57611  ORF Transcript_42212/g.57611 Transcript_42212/m.57611 type:complete len:241 (-) Transcript_42212:283-1005(-)
MVNYSGQSETGTRTMDEETKLQVLRRHDEEEVFKQRVATEERERLELEQALAMSNQDTDGFELPANAVISGTAQMQAFHENSPEDDFPALESRPPPIQKAASAPKSNKETPKVGLWGSLLRRVTGNGSSDESPQGGLGGGAAASAGGSSSSQGNESAADRLARARGVLHGGASNEGGKEVHAILTRAGVSVAVCHQFMTWDIQMDALKDMQTDDSLAFLEGASIDDTNKIKALAALLRKR